MKEYERPSTMDKIWVSISLGMIALLFYGIATHGPRGPGTYLYGTISLLLLLLAATFTWPENIWPKSLIFENKANKDAER